LALRDTALIYKSARQNIAVATNKLASIATEHFSFIILSITSAECKEGATGKLFQSTFF
jgi:hypothetical protein